MDKVRDFFHVTSFRSKSQIISANALVPQTHNPKQEWMWLLDSQYKEKIPKGVWFSSTLHFRTLPNKSLYGGERFLIPIEAVINQLDGDVDLYQGKTTSFNNNTYVRLMLVKEGDQFACLQHMEKLDLENNDFMTKCISESQFQTPRRPIFVETFVPYKIDIGAGEWDKVQQVAVV